MTHERRTSRYGDTSVGQSTLFTCIRKGSAYLRTVNALARAVGPVREIRRFLVPRPRKVLSVQEAAISIDHLHRQPAMSIRDFADTRAALQQGCGRMVSKIVQPHRRCSDLFASCGEGPSGRVRVVGPQGRRVRREDIGGGFDRCPRVALPLERLASSAPSRASVSSVLLRFVRYHPSWFPSIVFHRNHGDRSTDEKTPFREIDVSPLESRHLPSPAASPGDHCHERSPVGVFRQQVIDHPTYVGGGGWVHLPDTEGGSSIPSVLTSGAHPAGLEPEPPAPEAHSDCPTCPASSPRST